MKVNLISVFVLFVFLVSANSQWSCGDDCTATLESGKLRITGTGKMEDYKSESYPPWYDSRDSIKSVVIGSGITTIGESAFSSCDGLMSVAIPNSVTEIRDGAFNGCSSLTSIAIPSSVTEIGENTFQGCSALKSITIPNGVKVIRDSVFSGCSSLTSVTISDSVTAIGEDTFSECSALKSITIPDSVAKLGWSAFYGCSALTSIVIPKSVEEIWESTFIGCSSLSTITVAEGNKYFKSVDNVLFTKDGKKLIKYAPKKTETSYTVPDGVTEIIDGAFKKSLNLKSIKIPSSITTIGYGVFEDCSSLASITIPGSVTTMGEDTFSGCSSLTSGSIGTIEWKLEAGELSFTGEGKMMDFKYSSARPWYESKGSIGKVTISDKITTIGGYAFEGCSNLASVTIPLSVKMIGGGVFYNCPEWTSGKLGNIEWTLSGGVLSFTGSGNMPEFYPGGAPWYPSSSKITSVSIENGITSIGDYAFYDCNNLNSVTLPSSVTLVGFNVGVNVNMENVENPENVKRPMLCGADCLAYFSDEVLTIEGSGEMTDFSSSTYLSYSGISAPWYSVKGSIKEVKFSGKLTAIGSYAFYGCASLTTVEIPNSVTTIGESAFSSCSKLTSIEIPNSVTTIGDGAFSGCSLTSIEIPNSVTTIGKSAFSGSALTSITIPNSVTEIEESTFDGCSSLTSVTIPNSVTTIGFHAFYDCETLSSISVDSKNNYFQSIDGVLFKKGKYFTLVKYPPEKNDTEYTIPANVLEISMAAFVDCIHLETVKFCGKLNDYLTYYVVTGDSSFEVLVSSAFEGDSFFRKPITTSLTEEDCPREADSSSSHTGVIVGCVCGVAALVVIVAVVVFVMKSKSKNESVAMESVS